MKMLFVYLTVMSEKNYLPLDKLLVAFFLFVIQIVNSQDSGFIMKTQYDNGVFETEAYMETPFSQEIMHSLISEIVLRFRRLEIDSLEWALKGLSGEEEEKSFISVNYESAAYVPNTQIIDIFINVLVGKSNFKSIKVSVLMYTDDKTFIEVEVHDSNFFLKSARGTLSVRQAGSRLQFAINSSVRFAWFFNLFISTSNYNAVAEWRIQKVLENLNEEARKRSADGLTHTYH